MRIGVLVLLCGCADIERSAPGACGNGVIDPAEDCDRFAPAGQACGASGTGAGACRFVCDVAACPPGWGCRTDGVCHHATGLFRAAADVGVAADDFLVGDVDGDGVVDLLGIRGAALRVLFGDGAGGFGDELVRLLPVPLTGRPTTGDLDGDGRADIAVPYRQGVALLGGRADRSLGVVPVAAYPAAHDWLVPFRAAGASPEEELFGLEVSDDPPHVAASVFSIPDLAQFGPVDVGDGLVPADLEARLAVADDDGDGFDEILLAAVDGELRRCNTSGAVLPGDPTTLVCEVLDHGTLRLAGAALFADATGEGDLDVVLAIDDSGGGGGAVAVLPGDGGGGYGAAALDVELSAMGMPLAAGDLDGDGATDWVTEDGIFLDPRGPPVWTFSAPIREALVTPLSGGDLPDVVVAGAAEVTLLLNRDAGSFTPRRFPTEGRPFCLRSGSFDGDRIGDVVFGERPASGADALLLLFGQSGTFPADPVRIAGLPSIEHIETGLIENTAGLYDGATDIFVSTAAGPDGIHPVAVFEGAADRNLNSPLVLTVNYRSVMPEDVFAGRFIAGPGPGDDLLAVAREPGGQPRPFIAEAEPDAIFRLDRVASAVLDHPPPVGCTTEWAAGDRDGDGSLELAALDCEGTLRVLRVEPPGAAVRFSETTRTDLPPPAGAFRLELADLDDDGRADVVASDGGGVRIVWADPARATTSVEARAVARLSASGDGDGVPELAVLTEDGLFVGRVEGDDVRVPQNAAATVTGTRMAVADLDGDGLDDLVVGDGTGLTVLLAVSHLGGLGD